MERITRKRGGSRHIAAVVRFQRGTSEQPIGRSHSTLRKSQGHGVQQRSRVLLLGAGDIPNLGHTPITIPDDHGAGSLPGGSRIASQTPTMIAAANLRCSPLFCSTPADGQLDVIYQQIHVRRKRVETSPAVFADQIGSSTAGRAGSGIQRAGNRDCGAA